MNSHLLDILENRPQDLLIPDEMLQSQALDAVKQTFDPIANKYSIFEEIHVDGLDAEQVWAQAEMVIDGVVEKVMSEEIPELCEVGVLKRTASAALSDDEDEDESDPDDSEGFESALENEKSEEESVADESDNEDEKEETGIEAGSDSDIDMNDFDGKDDYEESDLEENEEDKEEGEDEENDDASEAEAGDSGDKDAFGLNKGLFNLDDFKSQVLALEDDNMDDDDENIDYFADPDAQDSEFDDEKDDDVKFEDFFAPPRKTKSKKSASKKSQKAFEGFNLEPENEEYEEAMDSVRKDLFADEEEEDEEDGKENLSTFEKQQREIMKQINQLESENVGEKSWQVKGEAKAKDRPENSLLEADLDFERSAKPVPVITKETTETLEDMIRRRIKTYDFDDLPRRVPDSLPEFKPSKLAEVQETKSTKGLGELYEEEYIRKENPDAYVSAEAEKQSEAHKEIKSLWSDLSRKLDTLSSWTYTPKAPKPSISIVANTAAIAMEEAQPTAMATESTLAPQEVYNPTAENKREVVGHSGLPVAKSEMSREERKRERRKHKAKKAKILKEREEEQKVKAQKKGSKADIMQTLKKGNVTIIDKKGAKRDISGNLKKNKAALGASQLKL